MADVILNHKGSCNYKDVFTVVEVDPNDQKHRNLKTILKWKLDAFYFPRPASKTCNDFEWHWYHFTGTDYDAKTTSQAFSLSKETKGWADDSLWTMKAAAMTTLCMLILTSSIRGYSKPLRLGLLVYRTGVQGFSLLSTTLTPLFMRNAHPRYSCKIR